MTYTLPSGDFSDNSKKVKSVKVLLCYRPRPAQGHEIEMPHINFDFKFRLFTLKKRSKIFEIVIRVAPPHKIWTQIQTQSCAGLTSYINSLSCEVLWYTCSSLKFPTLYLEHQHLDMQRNYNVYSSSNTHPTVVST